MLLITKSCVMLETDGSGRAKSSAGTSELFHRPERLPVKYGMCVQRKN